MTKTLRFSKMNQVNLKQVEAIASLGLIDEEIAVILGISPRTLNYWKKKPEFLQSLKKGKLKADVQVTKRLYENAKNGDNTAIIFWLKNRRPDLWRDKQEVEHSGEVKGGTVINVISAVPRPGKEKEKK